MLKQRCRVSEPWQPDRVNQQGSHSKKGICMHVAGQGVQLVVALLLSGLIVHYTANGILWGITWSLLNITDAYILDILSTCQKSKKLQSRLLTARVLQHIYMLSTLLGIQAKQNQSREKHFRGKQRAENEQRRHKGHGNKQCFLQLKVTQEAWSGWKSPMAIQNQ